jgi:predicted nucleic acid-binding protein
MTPLPGLRPLRQVCILDTNVVLDWLIFGDSSCDALGEAIRGGSMQWIATLAMRDEFDHVVGRGRFIAPHIDPADLRSTWDDCCEMVVAPENVALLRPRCRDPDDQMFVDLAWVARPGWLLSRDRAVLTLARRFLAVDVIVTTPSNWRGQAAC